MINGLCGFITGMILTIVVIARLEREEYSCRNRLTNEAARLRVLAEITAAQINALERENAELRLFQGGGLSAKDKVFLQRFHERAKRILAVKPENRAMNAQYTLGRAE